MKQSIIAGMAALLSTTLAAPAYVPYVFNTSQPAIDGLPITANNGYFWIGKPTTATCPTYDSACPSQNTTIISGPTYGQTWWMGILEEGGQRIFLPTYAQPGYSAADSNNFTPSRVSYSYILNTETTTDGHLLLKYYHSDWWACPTGEEGVWEVTATLDPAGCLPFAWELRETTAAAPQYYNCEGCESRL
ncbi:hypothetical protein KCU60_g16845, partial [Aureobasidium melanogenum]